MRYYLAGGKLDCQLARRDSQDFLPKSDPLLSCRFGAQSGVPSGPQTRQSAPRSPHAPIAFWSHRTTPWLLSYALAKSYIDPW